MKPLLCPFCGAPQKGYIPADTIQIKCQYCGAIFLVPPSMGGETHRCFNHPERLAIGKCNECGESFCGDCLHAYNSTSESARITLYLCPSCLRRRYVEKADKLIFVGIVFILVGIFMTLVNPFYAVLSLAGVVAIFYGFTIKGGMPEEKTIGEMQEEQKKRESELASTGEGIDPEEAYDKLVSQYVNHWGVQTGMELLRDEIVAYTMQGMSYSEAVIKVFQQHEKKSALQPSSL